MKKGIIKRLKEKSEKHPIITTIVFLSIFGFGYITEVGAFLLGIFVWGLVVYWCLIRPIKLWKQKKKRNLN